MYIHLHDKLIKPSACVPLSLTKIDNLLNPMNICMVHAIHIADCSNDFLQICYCQHSSDSGKIKVVTSRVYNIIGEYIMNSWLRIP